MNLSITKEDVDKLPLEKCSIEVVVVENRLVAESAIEQLKQTQQSPLSIKQFIQFLSSQNSCR